MSDSSLYQLDDVEEREWVPGFFGKMIHSASMTMAYWRIEKGSELPEHSHPHEQVVNMLEGRFTLVLSGTPHHLKKGDVLVIPSNAPHSGVADEDARILDVFCPVRDDYRTPN